MEDTDLELGDKAIDHVNGWPSPLSRVQKRLRFASGRVPRRTSGKQQPGLKRGNYIEENDMLKMHMTCVPV
jgi:hypothetical protein